MGAPEITRCENCTHECDDLFIDTARGLIMTDDKTYDGLKRAEDKERILQIRLRCIADCALSASKISVNLEGLMEGRLSING